MNLRRWLTPGGRFAFAVRGPLDDNVWMTATRAAVAGATALAPVDPAAPGLFRYADLTVLPALLEQAGFAGISVADWRQSLPIGQHATAAGGDASERAWHALTAAFGRCERAGAVRVPARVHIVSARAAGSPSGGPP